MIHLHENQNLLSSLDLAVSMLFFPLSGYFHSWWDTCPGLEGPRVCVVQTAVKCSRLDMSTQRCGRSQPYPAALWWLHTRREPKLEGLQPHRLTYPGLEGWKESHSTQLAKHGGRLSTSWSKEGAWGQSPPRRFPGQSHLPCGPADGES